MQQKQQHHQPCIVCLDRGQRSQAAPVFGHVAWPVPVPANPDDIILAAPGEDGSPELVSPRVQALFLVLAALSVPLVALGRMAGVL